MQEKNHRDSVQQLIEELGSERPLPVTPQRGLHHRRSNLVFQAPTFRRFLRMGAPFLMLCGVMLTLAFVASSFYFFLRGGLDTTRTEWALIAWASVSLVLLGVPSGYLINGYLLAQRGRIILAPDGLVERGLFGHERTFTYDQIYRIVHSRKQWHVRYYGYSEKGKVDHSDIHQASLISVRNAAKMARELQSRAGASQPSRKAVSRFSHRTFGKPVMIQLCGAFLVAIAAWGSTKLSIETGFQGVLILALIGAWMIVAVALRLPFWVEKWWRGGVPSKSR